MLVVGVPCLRADDLELGRQEAIASVACVHNLAAGGPALRHVPREPFEVGRELLQAPVGREQVHLAPEQVERLLAGVHPLRLDLLHCEGGDQRLPDQPGQAIDGIAGLVRGVRLVGKGNGADGIVLLELLDIVLGAARDRRDMPCPSRERPLELLVEDEWDAHPGLLDPGPPAGHRRIDPGPPAGHRRLDPGAPVGYHIEKAADQPIHSALFGDHVGKDQGGLATVSRRREQAEEQENGPAGANADEDEPGVPTQRGEDLDQ